MVTLKLSDSEARALQDAVSHACDDLYMTIEDELGRDNKEDAIRQSRLDRWEKVRAVLAAQLKAK